MIFKLVCTKKLQYQSLDEQSKDTARDLAQSVILQAINSMELQKISEVMDKFESQFEDLDVKTSVSITNY